MAGGRIICDKKNIQSQTGAYMSMGKGSVYRPAKMQRLNTKSSIKAELVGVDDIMPQIILTRNLLLFKGMP